MRYVAPGGACGGASPCYATIQAAVDAAAAGDEIRIAAGAYTGVATRSGIKQVVFVDKGVAVRGGFTTANWNTPNPTANPTTVDAQGLGRGLVVSGTQSAITVEGLRITGGNATALGGYPGNRDAGGGIYVYLANVTVRSCTLYSNTASSSASVRGYGGGLAAVYSTVTIANSTVEHNRAGIANRGYGGGLLVRNDPGWGGSIALTGNIIRNNIASTANTGAGGGVWLNTCTGDLTGNEIRDNAATTAASGSGDGGGVYANGCDLTLANNIVQGNRAGPVGSGGGLYFYDVEASLTGNQVIGNRAGDGSIGSGGGLYAASDLDERVAQIVLTNNTLRDNIGCRNDGPTIALCRGGGARLVRVKATLTGNIIQANIADSASLISDNGRGGGVSLEEPFDVTLTANTIRDNVASTGGFGFGGGIEASAQTPRPGFVLLEGNTVQSNDASLGYSGYGGGVYLSNVTVTLASNSLVFNTASRGKDGFGGGLYGEGGHTTLNTNTIHGNIASMANRGVGGGLRIGSTTYTRTVATLTDNIIRANIGTTAVTNTSTFRGGAGGLSLWLTSGTVSGNIFVQNTGGTAQAAYCGGASIHTGDQAATLFSGNLVLDNVGGPDGSLGGGVCLSGAVTAANNTVTGNRAATSGAGRGGGVVVGSGPDGSQVGGPVTLADNIIQGNVAASSVDGSGGGVYVSRSSNNPADTFTVTRNLITDNTASQGGPGSGGGIYLGTSHLARLDANTILRNVAAANAATTGLGGGVYIADSHEFSLTNNVVARNRANTQGGGIWMGKTQNPFDIFPTWGRFLHTTIADNQGGAGAWLESPLPAGTLTDAYSGGTTLLVTVTGFYRVGDQLFVAHANGTTREWRRLTALEYLGSKAHLTLDSALANPYPIGSTVRDASPMFVDTIISRHTLGIGARDQPIVLVNTLWYGNGTNTADNLGAILTQGDVSGNPTFVNPADGDYHIGSTSAGRDTGVDAGLRTDMDGEARPFGPGYDIGADEWTGQGTRTPTPTATRTPTATPTATPSSGKTPTPTSTGSAPTPGQHRHLPMVLRQ